MRAVLRQERDFGARPPARVEAAASAVDAPAGVEEASDERRQSARRALRADRALAMTGVGFDQLQWLPRRWPYLLMCMIAAIGSSAFAVGRSPGPTSAIFLGLAVLLAAGLRPAYGWAQGHGPRRQLLVAIAVVIVPMFLFGLAVNRWNAVGSLPWDVAIASLL